jgi:HicB family
MRKSNFALRLQPSLLEELRSIAASEGVALNQLINVAVAEKLSALRTEDYFRARARNANRSETTRILEKAGTGNPAVPGDELPTTARRMSATKRPNSKTRKLSASSPRNRRKQK